MSKLLLELRDLLQSLLAVQGVDGAVGGLLAGHEHGAKGGAHAGCPIKLCYLQTKGPEGFSPVVGGLGLPSGALCITCLSASQGLVPLR